MNNKIIATGALLLATSGIAYAAAGATASDEDENAQGQPSGVAARTTTPGIIKCDGGRQLSMHARIGNKPFTFAETAVPDEDRALPGATLTVAGPSRGTDTFLITVSGETQVTGGDANDWMGIEVKDNGVNIQPYTAVGDVMAFTGEPSWNLNSGQFCVKVGRGVHRFQVYTNLRDNSGSHTLNGWVDDYTVSFLRFS